MGRRKRNATYEETSFDFLFTCLSLVLSLLVAWGTYTFCYQPLEAIYRSPILPVALTFLVFTLALLMLMLLLSVVTGRFKENVFTGRSSTGIVVLIILGVCAGVALLAGLFQFLYQLNFVKGTDAHIYMVDISYSMDANDPHGKSFDAIDELVDEKGDHFPYMIYTFNDDIQLIRGMLTNAEQEGYKIPVNTGTTDLYRCLDLMMDDLQSGQWKIPSNTQVIVITDAETSEPSNYTQILQRYTDAGLSVSTIYLKRDNSSLLQKISAITGGTYVQINDASELGGAVAMAASGTRSLLENRDSGSELYAVLRILFLTLLGCGIGFGGMMAYGRHEAGRLILISSPIKALVASGIYEACMETLPAGERLKEFFVILLLTLLGTQLTAMAQERAYGDDGIYYVKGNQRSPGKPKKGKSSSSDDYDFLFN